MALWDSLIRPALFRLDPETAHRLALRALQSGVVGSHRTPLEHSPRELFGVRFPNPVGLAAGFDKSAMAVSHWYRLGFGFVEVGTVTLRPQPGNPRPRILRLAGQRALINRMGFNNNGAEVVARRLAQAESPIPVGVNIGMSKGTDPDTAHEDYAGCFRLLAPHAAYVAVNVSSPNTPGLRDLQAGEALRRILSSLRELDPAKPLLVKLAPDLDEAGIDQVVEVALECQASGLIATNTTLQRPGLKGENQDGGLSGAPLFDLAAEVQNRIGTRLPVVASGGIMGPADAKQRLDAGACLVQAYTGFVYGGPKWADQVVNSI